ncbi:hypothetical protein ACFFRR_004013 [Megaselia abdita]
MSKSSKILLLPLVVVAFICSSALAVTEVETVATTEKSPVITSSVPPSVNIESTTTEVEDSSRKQDKQQQTTTQQQIQSTETFLPVDYDVTLTTLTNTRDVETAGAIEETETHSPSTERVKTTTATTTEEVMINDIHIEQKLKNGLYRIKLAEITTNEFHSGASDVKKVPESGGKINIIDLYPSKVDDFVNDDENKLSNAISQTDFTGKLLQERDGVITEIEKKFQLKDFMKPKRRIIPLNTRTEFIDRRVKKSYGAPQPPQTEFPLHIRNSNSSDAIRKIDFANTKFNTAKDGDRDGANKQPPQHPEFSTTKFYNSKELYNEMLHKKLSGAPTMTTSTQSPLPLKYVWFPAGFKSLTSTSTTKPVPTTIETPTVTTVSSISASATVGQRSSSSQLPSQSPTTTTRNKETIMTTEKTETPKTTVATKTTTEKLAPTIAAVTKTTTTEGDYPSTTKPTLSPSSSSSSVMASSTMVSPSPSSSSAVPPPPGVASVPSVQSVAASSTSSSSFQSLRPITRPRVLTRLEEKMNSLECEIQSVPQESHVWRGNETHELMLPIMVSKICEKDDDCAEPTPTWEGVAEIQSGDVLLVEINDLLLYQNKQLPTNTNVAHFTQVYQVTRAGHEHCDVTEGVLLDITPLIVDGRKLVTLYDKDLTEGTNLLIVVSELWGKQCIRLKVTVKSDNCGENADCSGKGVCYSNDSMEGYECQCCNGFAGSHCEEIDACNPSPCTNNGICVDLSQGHEGNAYQCLCPYGYTGKNCQYEADPCNPNDCQNGGSCTGTSTQFRCDCAPGYTGQFCQQNSNECESSPCIHGICVDQEHGFRCFCQPGFAGELCDYEYNECESNPCLNDGECIDQIGGYECKCSKGYIGNRCQMKVDFCANKPCPEGHRCIDHGNDFSCECPGGRNGPDCNQVPRTQQCNVNPCANSGTCWTSGDSFYCACRPGYTGKMCEDEFIVETVVSSSEFMVDDTSTNFNDKAFGSVVMKSPIEFHNVYIAAGVLAAAIFIVAIVVTICHCKVNQTYRKFSARQKPCSLPSFLNFGWKFGGRNKMQKTNRHWLSGKNSSPPSSSTSAPVNKCNKNHLPACNVNNGCPPTSHYHTHNGIMASTAGSQSPSSQLQIQEQRPFQRHLAMNLENDMYYTVDFSESQNSPLIQ